MVARATTTLFAELNMLTGVAIGRMPDNTDTRRHGDTKSESRVFTRDPTDSCDVSLDRESVCPVGAVQITVPSGTC